MFYAGIGSRKTPQDVIFKMHNVAKNLANAGLILRSGGAEGADQAFETGCDIVMGGKEIFLPFKGFRQNQSPNFGTTFEARQLAKQFHPKWDNVGCHGRDFLGRNCYEILGRDLNDPVAFVLCWTQNGQERGGTGQTIRVAKHFEIPILNFAIMTDEEISDKIFQIIERTEHENFREDRPLAANS